MLHFSALKIVRLDLEEAYVAHYKNEGVAMGAGGAAQGLDGLVNL